MSEQETGQCMVCGEEGVLCRKYYYYDTVTCDCCIGQHFEIVRHHSSCQPKPPEVIKIALEMKPMDTPQKEI